jgi:hypothetical protein
MAVMWEVRAAEGRLAELVAYVDGHADPAAQVYRSEGLEPRVVVIDPTDRGIVDVPAELVARPPHAWQFVAVPRAR